MVEYAILLILVTTLAVGGIELSSIAFNSNRASEAAKATAGAWALQKRGVGATSSVNYDSLSSISTCPGTVGEVSFDPAYLPAVETVDASFPTLPEIETVGADLDLVRLDADYVCDLNDESTALAENFVPIHIGKQIIIDGERYRIIDVGPGSDPRNEARLDRELPAAVPTGQGDALGVAVIPRLADHTNGGDLTGYARPVCVPGDLDGDGQLDDSTYGLPAAADPLYDFYLYNPKVLDITDCVNNAAAIDAFLNGLPALNQAIYPIMENDCFDAAFGVTLNCADFNGGNPNHLIIMRLPGRVVQGFEAYVDNTRIAADMTVISSLFYDYTPGDSGWKPCVIGSPAGCYTDSPLPALAIGCTPFGTGAAYDANTLPACSGTPADDVDVRALVRYRAYLNGLLLNVSSRVVDAFRTAGDPFPPKVFTYWGLKVNGAAVEHLDVRSAALETQGFLGTEIAKGGVLKGRRDFRGCYQTLGDELINCN